MPESWDISPIAQRLIDWQDKRPSCLCGLQKSRNIPLINWSWLLQLAEFITQYSCHCVKQGGLVICQPLLILIHRLDLRPIFLNQLLKRQQFYPFWWPLVNVSLKKGISLFVRPGFLNSTFACVLRIGAENARGRNRIGIRQRSSIWTELLWEQQVQATTTGHNYSSSNRPCQVGIVSCLLTSEGPPLSVWRALWVKADWDASAWKSSGCWVLMIWIQRITCWLPLPPFIIVFVLMLRRSWVATNWTGTRLRFQKQWHTQNCFVFVVDKARVDCFWICHKISLKTAPGPQTVSHF